MSEGGSREVLLDRVVHPEELHEAGEMVVDAVCDLPTDADGFHVGKVRLVVEYMPCGDES